jgi:aspartate/methionine/tyrosine aminotransferase
MGFEVFESGSTFYIWARIPREFDDAVAFNEMLMREAGVGVTPGSAFADSEKWDAYVRICIAREDKVLQSAIEKIRSVVSR